MSTKSQSPQQQVKAIFEEVFNKRPSLIARAPGRVNLIGEHTDYNDGFVLPLAIDRGIWMAAHPRSDSRVLVHALDFDEVIDIDLMQLNREASGVTAYIQGIAWALRAAGYPPNGFSGVLKGNIPIGAGLSSSAALELVLLRTFTAFSGVEWEPVRMAFLAQKAENEWVGVKCGIMDQLISAVGQKNSALLIDCRSLHTEPSPLPSDCAVVVIDTGTRRGDVGLLDSAYNARRMQCEVAAQITDVKSLRDLSLEHLEACASQLGEVLYRRAHHVVTENTRTLDAHRAMLSNDPEQLGLLMQQSHHSLRDHFEVSSEALNTAVSLALEHPGCYGARMTGGGFAGCAIALVEAAQAEEFMRQVARRYQESTGIEMQAYLCSADEGASIVSFEMVEAN